MTYDQMKMPARSMGLLSDQETTYDFLMLDESGGYTGPGGGTGTGTGIDVTPQAGPNPSTGLDIVSPDPVAPGSVVLSEATTAPTAATATAPGSNTALLWLLLAGAGFWYAKKKKLL